MRTTRSIVRRLLLLLLIGAACGALPAGAHGPGGKLGWRRDVDAGLKEAARTGRPVLLYFRAHTCVNSRQLDADGFSSDRVIAASRPFVRILVDSNAKATAAALRARYAATLFPTVVCTGPDGEVAARMKQRTPEALVALLQGVAKAYEFDRLMGALLGNRAAPPWDAIRRSDAALRPGATEPRRRLATAWAHAASRHVAAALRSASRSPDPETSKRAQALLALSRGLDPDEKPSRVEPALDRWVADRVGRLGDPRYAARATASQDLDRLQRALRILRWRLTR